MEITLSLYALATVIVGIIVLRESELGQSFFLKKGQKSVGPSYWGVYDVACLQESESLKTLELPPQ
jgi:hypothetical protein